MSESTAIVLAGAAAQDAEAVKAAAMLLNANVLSLSDAEKSPLALVCTRGRWALHASLPSGRAKLDIDIEKAPWRAALVPQDAPLSRAVGRCHSVIDLTAGFLRDAFRLAARERTVVCYERDPVVHFVAERLLEDLARERSTLRSRIELVSGDATGSDDRRAECVYLDPMFDDHAADKRAAAKKELAVLAQIVARTPRTDDGALFAAALRRAEKQVVVKRAAHQAPLAEGQSRTVSGKGFRFDVYLV